MKKKISALLFVLALLVSLVACGGSSDPLSVIEGASKDQLSAIQTVLNDCKITVKSCEKVSFEDSVDESSNAIAAAVGAALLEAYAPYAITDDKGDVYRLLLKKEDNSVFSITDKDGEFVYGSLAGLFNQNSDTDN